MAEQQTQQQQVDPAAAREFVAQFHPDAAAVKTMADADVLAYHGRIKPVMDTSIAAAIKARGSWDPEWRKTFAGDDPEAMKTLERMADPTAVWKSYTELRGKVSKGELKAVTPFPATGTDEQKAAWRTEQGVPAKFEEYKLPDGMVVGDEDKPFIDDFLKSAHEANMPNTYAANVVKWWDGERTKRAEAAATAEAALKKETDDKLHTLWGQDFRPTMTKIEGVLDAYLPSGSEELKQRLVNTVGRNVEFAQLMANIATQINPGGTLVGGGMEGNTASVTEWLSKADAMMRTNRKEYDRVMAPEYQKYAKAYQIHTGNDWGKK